MAEVSDGEPDYSSPADLAISISWPLYGDGTKVDPRSYTGVVKYDADSDAVLDAYRQARALAVERQIWDGKPGGLLNNQEYFGRCSAFIATVVIDTITPEFPQRTLYQFPWMSDEANGWVIVGTTEDYDPSSYLPGDIFLTRGEGHDFMWIGEYGGFSDVVADASLTKNPNTTRTAALHRSRIDPATGVDNKGRPYDVWRYEGIPVETQEPVFNKSTQCGVESTVTVPTTEHITYVESREGTQVKITAVADDLYRIADGSQWEWIFDVTAEPCPATPIAPTLEPATSCGVEPTVSIPDVEGVTYGQTRDGNTVTVIASAADGFVFSQGAKTKWTFDVTPELCVVDPVAPTFKPATSCGVEPIVSVPSVKGVVYEQERKGDIMTVTALVTDGYVFSEGVETQWTFSMSAEVCPVDPVDPPSAGVSGGVSSSGVSGGAEASGGTTVSGNSGVSSESLAKTGANSVATLALVGIILLSSGLGGLAVYKRKSRGA